jgi:hypothetical protein
MFTERPLTGPDRGLFRQAYQSLNVRCDVQKGGGESLPNPFTEAKERGTPKMSSQCVHSVQLSRESRAKKTKCV